MTTARIRLRDDRLYLEGALTGAPVVLPEDAAATFEGWCRTYQLNQTKDDAQVLLSLGCTMLAWLDELTGWLTPLRRNPTLTLEFAVDFEPQSLAVLFLEAPWELLADDKGHWALNERFRFHPLRRVGKPQASLTLNEHRLSMVFMAAEVDGQKILDYEREEAAIIM